MSKDQALRESDLDAGFLAALLDSLRVGVVACDTAGRLVLMNRALREVQGIAADLPEDFPAGLRGVLFDADLRPLTWDQTPLMRARLGEHVESDLVTIVPGRRTRVFAVTAQPIVDDRNRRRGAVAISNEVTAIRRIERFRACQRAVGEILRTSRSMATAAPRVVEAVGSALGWPATELFLVDEVTGELAAAGQWSSPGGDYDDLFAHVPVKGAGIVGRAWQTGQPVWMPDLSDATGMAAPAEQARVEACLRHGIHTVLAVPVRDGVTVLGVLICYASAPECQEDLYTLLLDGVAGQIGVHVALRRAEELARQLARSQNDFVNLTGHELRTPLASIAALAGMLADDPGGYEDSRDMVDAIARHAGTLRRIVTTLLDLAGLDCGHLPLTIGRVDLSATITAACQDAELEGLRLRVDVPPGLELDGDARRLRQVADDLLCNAVTYSRPDGDIDVALAASDDLLTLTIADDGIGTPADEGEYVFNRFYRPGNTRHRGMPGSGLGLSRARTIVQLHHGTISLAANRPTGTEVTVRLPRSQATR